MEPREQRGLMEMMRAFFTIIRKRFGQLRTRQKTNNYRICRNLAMAKIESKKEKRLKTAKVTKVNNSAAVTAEVISSKRNEDGAPRGLRERMLTALRVLREGRKPQWVRQRGGRRNTDGLNMDYTETLNEPQAREDIQSRARENVHETQASLEIKVRVDIHRQALEDHPSQASDNMNSLYMDGLNMEYSQVGADLMTQAGDEIQTGAEENIQTQANPDILTTVEIQSQAGEGIERAKDPSDPQAREDIKTEVKDELQTQTSLVLKEDIQTQAQNAILLDEPASWVVAYGQMWQRMAQHEGCDLYKEDIHAIQAKEEPASWVVANSQMWQKSVQHDQNLRVENVFDTQAKESLDDILAREGLEADEPASWVVANSHMWQRTVQQNELDHYGEDAFETQARESFDDILAREGLGADEPASWVGVYCYALNEEDLKAIQATEEPACWAMANWQRMAQQDVEGDFDGQAMESLDDILAREDLEANEPASWLVANGQIWGQKQFCHLQMAVIFPKHQVEALANPHVAILHQHREADY